MRRENLAISINGGGALGVGPVALMVELEKAMGGKKLSDLSIAFGGTSTGAIVAALLDEGCSAADIRQLYRDNLKQIFKKYPLSKRILHPSCPKYDHTHLKNLLKEKMKGTCKDWEKPIFIPATFMNGNSVEKVWDRRDENVEKWFAVLTSTSAPTYFDVEKDDEGNCFCDGGMWANSPIAVLNAGLNVTDYRGKYRILAFDTDMDTENTLSGNQSLLGWGKYILNEWVARSGKSGDFEVKADIGRENVKVLSPVPNPRKKMPMDDVSDEALDKIEKIWVDYFNENRDQILEFVNNNG